MEDQHDSPIVQDLIDRAWAARMERLEEAFREVRERMREAAEQE